MKRGALIGIGLVVLLAIALPAALLYYVGFTEAGLRFIAQRAPARIGRVQLDIGDASGTLAQGVTLSHLDIEHERAHIRLEGIKGRLTLAPLLWRTIAAEEVTVREALVQVRRRQRPPTKYTPRFLPRGLVIQVASARIGEFTLIAPNGRQLKATALSASGDVLHKRIRIRQSALTYQEALRVTGEGELRAAAPMQLTLDARARWATENQPAWVLRASADGDFDTLATKGEISSPLRATFSGKATDLTRSWRWMGEADLQEFSSAPWTQNNQDGPLGKIKGRLRVTADASGFGARGALTPQGLKAGVFDTEFAGSYAKRALTVRQMRLVHRRSRTELTGSGRIALAPGGPELDLQGAWQNFRWPLVGKNVAVKSAAGEYALAGIWPYRLHATGTFSARDLPPMPFEMQGLLNKRELTLSQGRVTAFGGSAEASGKVSWSPRDAWSLAGRANGIDPALVRKDLPGHLNFAFAAQGEGFGENPDFSLAVRDIGGRLRGAPARGVGNLARHDGAWRFENVRVALGNTTLELDGRMAEALDLEFSVDAQDLSLLNPASKGRLHAQGTVAGTLKAPRIDVTANAADVEHDGVAVQSLVADIDFDVSAQARAAIELRNATYNKRSLQRALLKLQGTALDHALDLQMNAEGLKATAQAHGAYVDGVWRGQLQKLGINGREALRLTLETPTDVMVSAEAASITVFCLDGSPARVCASADWTPRSWKALLAANELPMSTLTAGLTPGVEYRGTINFSAHGSGGAETAVQGELRAQLTNAELTHRLASGRTDVITLGTGNVTAVANAAAIEAQMSLHAGEIGTLEGNFTAQRSTPRWQDMPLKGELRAETAELGFVSLYVPEVDRASGQLLAQLSVSGTLGTPLMQGMVKLTNAQVDLYQINLALRQLNLEARLKDNGLQFDGSGRLGSGTAQVQGQLAWRDALPYGKFALQGARLRVVDIPEAQIDASPNLSFDIQGRRITVTGTVEVPDARIVPADLTDAVRASPDEVLVGAPVREPGSRFEVVSNITLKLGDKVYIDTSGLTGGLVGSITVRSGYDEVTRAAGELNVTEGKYTAYGRRLDIERGRLIFTGGPVGNPGVDIRAIKQFPDVKAGVNVRGTLLAPRLTFFSEPSLPQSQIVSLILAGGSLASAQSGAQNGAGNELLAQGGAILAQQLGSRIGLEDVSLESNLANETSLVLGKYLSPRLYVSYGISLTEALNTLKLRYTLDDHWTVKTEVGREHVAELVYTIEK